LLVLACTLAVIGMVGLASPASANSFTIKLWDNWLTPTVTYNDGGDLYCTKNMIYPKPSRVVVYAILTPVNGVGPKFSEYLPEGATTCWSLSRAYEDTYYKYTYQVTTLGFPTVFYSGYFYS
jgi:hypothetical protein